MIDRLKMNIITIANKDVVRLLFMVILMALFITLAELHPLGI